MRAISILLSTAILLCNFIVRAPAGNAQNNSSQSAAATNVERAPETSAPERIFTPLQLAEDFSIFRKALTQLHLGLYRYNSPAQIERAFDELETKLKSPMRDGEFFKLLAQFVSQIRCGHTYLNPLNQPKTVRARFFEGRIYLPFFFRIIDRKLIVTGNLSDKRLTTGSEVTNINRVRLLKSLIGFWR